MPRLFISQPKGTTNMGGSKKKEKKDKSERERERIQQQK